MNTVNPPTSSLKTLVWASVFAVCLAAILLVTAVLPAEYGVDPTGMGKKLDLMQLSGQGDDIVDPVVVSCKDELAQWTDSTTIVVPVHSGLEYKFHVQKGGKLDYAWRTDGAKVYFDLHGEPVGDKTGFFKSFKKGNESQSTGNFAAEFEGAHGWYFENKTQAPITVILNTKGVYRVLGLM
jgi:hypothetical protein